MDAFPLATRFIGMVMLGLLSAAPGSLASVTTEPPARQTEFSDRNYQSSRQVNISAPVTPASSTPSRAKPERNRRVIQSNSEKVKWISGRGAETEYRMYYEYDSTQITFATVCSNYRKGSIDYRNCRKAAKRWFGKRCNSSSGSGRMYCHASNAFRP